MIRVKVLNTMVTTVKEYMRNNFSQVWFGTCEKIPNTDYTNLVINYSTYLNKRDKVEQALAELLAE